MTTSLLKAHLQDLITSAMKRCPTGKLDRATCKAAIADYLKRLESYEIRHFEVVCDSTNNTEASIAEGSLIVTIKPLTPYAETLMGQLNKETR